MKKVLLILLIIVFLVSCSNANNTFTISEDQQKLIDEFGQPSNFMITMVSDRYEVWFYFL